MFYRYGNFFRRITQQRQLNGAEVYLIYRQQNHNFFRISKTTKIQQKRLQKKTSKDVTYLQLNKTLIATIFVPRLITNETASNLRRENLYRSCESQLAEK